MRIILISILLFLTSIAFGQTLKQVNGSYNIVGVSGGGPDYNVTGVFIDFTNTYTVADVDTGHIVWDQAGNQYRITSMVTTMPNIIEAVVNDFYASGAPQLGIGAISHHTDYLDLGLRVSTIPENIKANIITDAFLKIDLGLSGVADTARLNHYLKEVDFSNDTAYFRVFDYWPDTMLYELFYVTGPDWYFSDLRTDEDSVYFDISDRVTGDSVTTYSLPLIAGEQGPVGPQGPIGPQGPVGAEGPAGPEIDWYVKEISISGDSVFLDIYDRAQDTFVNSLFYISSGGYTIYETDSTFTSDRTGDLDGNFFRLINGSVIFSGLTGNPVETGVGTRFEWIPSLHAIRAVNINDGSLPTTIGEGSFGFGRDISVAGDWSGAGGNTVNVSGNYSYGFGELIDTEGNYSFSGGFGSNVPGNYSTSFGRNNFIGGNYSFATGDAINIDAPFLANLYSFGSGRSISISGSHVGALGWNLDVSGSQSFVAGRDIELAKGTSSAIGGYLTATGAGSNVHLKGFRLVSTEPSDQIVMGRDNFEHSSGEGRFFILGMGWGGVNQRTDAYHAYRINTGTNVYVSRHFINPKRSTEVPSVTLKVGGEVQVDSLIRIPTKLAAFTSDNILTELPLDSLGDIGIMTHNIYISDDTLTGPRTVFQDGNSLGFTGGALYSAGTVGNTPLSGAGTRWMWIPNKASMRWGMANSSGPWDDANIGILSTAWGSSPVASGAQSTAWGQGTLASDAEATAWGLNTEATYPRATAWGFASKATRDLSTAWGDNTTANGYASTATGIRVSAPSYGEFGLGSFATTYSAASPLSFNAEDRVFVIGIGTNTNNRKDAVSVWKDGNIGFGVSAPSHPLEFASGAHVTSNGKFVDVTGDTLTGASGTSFWTLEAGDVFRNSNVGIGNWTGDSIPQAFSVRSGLPEVNLHLENATDNFQVGVDGFTFKVSTGGNAAIAVDSDANDEALYIKVDGIYLSDYDTSRIDYTSMDQANNDLYITSEGMLGVKRTAQGKYKEITDDYTIQLRDYILFVNSSDPVTVTLPNNNLNRGAPVYVIQRGTGGITISGASGSTVNGEASVSVNEQYATVVLFNVGTNDFIASKMGGL